MAVEATSRRGEGGAPVGHDRDATWARRAQERALLVRYHRGGDAGARDELVTRMMPLVRRLARRYQRAGEPLDDLVQVGCVGLVKAIDRFDLERSTSFASFAVPTILGELKRHFRDHGWAVHVPRGMQERVLRVENASASLSRRLGRAPSVEEVARTLGIPVEEVLEAKEAGAGYETVSLDAPRPGDDDGSLTDTLGAVDTRLELVDDRSAIGPALAALPDRERRIISLRFDEDLTQQEIAERIGVSQMHVSRLLRRSLTKLRTVAEARAC